MSKLQQDSLDEKIWAQALAEFEGDSRRPGLWAKSYADAQGNEAVAKANYLSQRVLELQEEHQKHLLNEKKREISKDRLRKILGVTYDGKRYFFRGKWYGNVNLAITSTINVKGKDGSTPLMRSVRGGNVKLVKTLISFGADPKLTEGNFGTTIALSIATDSLNQAKDQHTRDTYQTIIDVLNDVDTVKKEQDVKSESQKNTRQIENSSSKIVSSSNSQRKIANSSSAPTDQDKSLLIGTYHPWRRFFARTTDSLFFIPIVYMFFMVVLFTVFNLFPHAMQDPQSVINRFFKLIEERPGSEIIVFTPIVILLWILLEAAFISLARATPGKWIFGIRITTRTGDKLSYVNALKRTFLVFVQGEGLGIPIVSFFTGIFAYLRLTKTGTTLWDTSVGSIVTHKKWGVIRAIVSVLFVLVSLFFLAVLNPMGNT